jgi:hypothetical protein
MRDHSIYKTGFDNTVIISDAYGSFDGDGHKIRNIVLNNYSGSDAQNVAFMNFSTIANTDFYNLVIMSCTATCPIIFTTNTGNTVNGQKGLVNCNFGIYVANSHPMSLPICNIAEDCCFNIKGRVLDNRKITFGQFTKRTHFNFEDLIMHNSSIFDITNSYSMTNVYITGKIKNLENLSYDKYTINEAILRGSLINSYIAVEYDGKANENLTQTISISGTGFIDKELWCKNGFNRLSNITNSTSNLNTITTAQAQDVEYLNSIGFAVVPVS